MGAVSVADVAALRVRLDALAAERARADADLTAADRAEVEQALMTIYARAGVVALAAGDEATSATWLAAARAHARDADQRELLDAAQASPARYQRLAHARYLFTNDRERAARKVCAGLARDRAGDAIARAARAELDAPRPLRGDGPTLARWNGCGVGFYGRRDQRGDGSYTTTHCVSVAWVPLLPIGAYVVTDEPGGYRIFARAPLSTFARLARLAVIAAVVLGIGGLALHQHLTDPGRLARKRFDAALASTERGDREAALQRLDRELTGPDFERVDADRRERAGAAVIRLTAALVPTPLAPGDLDQALRVVRRYQALPGPAKEGQAREAMLAALDGWMAALHDVPDAELTILREAAALARSGHDVGRTAALDARMLTLRLQMAAALAEAEPTEAVAILMAAPRTPETTAAAGKALAALADTPALLDDASGEVEAWLAAASPDDPDRAKVSDARDRAAAARAEADDEQRTPADLAAAVRRRPWDQRAAIRLAGIDFDAGRLDAAAARLQAFGAAGQLVRDGRVMLSQLAAARGDLDQADAILTAMLAPRLRRFVAAGGTLDEAAQEAEAQVRARLQRDDVPGALRAKVNAAATDAERSDAVMTWMREQIEAAPAVVSAQAAYVALGDVVPASLALGTYKVRRAQIASGPAREALLGEAERVFLSISAAAEGQPEFHLGLGEIYARLGKVDESEAELRGLLAKADPVLTFRVAQLYREIGSTARATEVATTLFATAPTEIRSDVAVLLALLTDEEDAREGWYLKADQRSPFVQSSLLELAAGRMQRAGQWAACAGKYEEAARTCLATANASNLAGYNNAAVAYLHAYGCSGDIADVAKAEAAMEKAYRATADDPIVVGNLAALLRHKAAIRVLARRVDARLLKLDGETAFDVVTALARDDQADPIQAELSGDPAWRRAIDLAAQYQILAPNNPDAYAVVLGAADFRQDAVAAAAVVDRMRQAKALDTSDAARARARVERGDDDAKYVEAATTLIDHMTSVVERPRVDPRTAALAHVLRAAARGRVGWRRATPADLDACLADEAAATRLWPALATGTVAVDCAIDRIALATPDASRWQQLRRTRAAVDVAADLATARDPLWAVLTAAPTWTEVAAHARAAHGRPGLDAVKLALLIDDPALAARAKASRADPLVRLRLEFQRLSDPTDPAVARDLELLAR
ncbi:MAG: hypothetical protein IPL61_29210 [Myxococcales bacterium]|nr:hypothetical protein [Myxococcales bacterium]